MINKRPHLWMLSAAMLFNVGCTSTTNLSEQRELTLSSPDAVLPALQQLLQPTQNRVEQGEVSVLIRTQQVSHKNLAQWQQQLSDTLSLPVDVRWQQVDQANVEVKIDVALIPETCRFEPNMVLSDAQCRHKRRLQMAMANQQHYRQGAPLLITESSLEVGAVERLRQGSVRIAEDPAKITDGSGGESGN
ncbi:hypothetical protein BOO91_00915 [Vibrio navarrensis]|uniref:Uncharacterized protein n=1 Tax=Vibrio navarrensis TaxID=29495 RepID=A0AAJ4LVC4_9VIBR|nr:MULTISPECIES: hypothetical protein [Vibrio]KJR24901.1 hypothetical protein UF06_17140 [Vibrio sp. S234-5]MBE3655446.1 hypothetical protein [Vibrio navarrensis]MBE3659508.1 hypothetical protein [Vibrio navarrensis]MBE3667638.1 hypothetical protein [Vibrio navarrensis]MBE4602307.1 hypothetical protein [Vibrio navarrensis]